MTLIGIGQSGSVLPSHGAHGGGGGDDVDGGSEEDHGDGEIDREDGENIFRLYI